MQVAIVGAGMSGLALAGALTNRGVTTRVFEQASRFARVGAGIQQSANAVRGAARAKVPPWRSRT